MPQHTASLPMQATRETDPERSVVRPKGSAFLDHSMGKQKRTGDSPDSGGRRSLVVDFEPREDRDVFDVPGHLYPEHLFQRLQLGPIGGGHLHVAIGFKKDVQQPNRLNHVEVKVDLEGRNRGHGLVRRIRGADARPKAFATQ
jgi:hypothetical protein